MLVDRQRLPLGMPGDDLEFGISQSAVPGEVGDRLVTEGMGRCPYPRFFGVQAHDLLHSPGAVFGVPAGLEEPSVVGMGGNVGSQGSGEAFPEEDVAVLAALSLLDPDLAGFEVHSPNLDPAQFAHPDPGVEEQPEHQAVLDVVRPAHHLVEPPEIVLIEYLGQPMPLLCRLQGALPPRPIG